MKFSNPLGLKSPGLWLEMSFMGEEFMGKEFMGEEFMGEEFIVSGLRLKLRVEAWG